MEKSKPDRSDLAAFRQSSEARMRMSPEATCSAAASSPSSQSVIEIAGPSVPSAPIWSV